jgi:hypothetical protein
MTSTVARPAAVAKPLRSARRVAGAFAHDGATAIAITGLAVTLPALVARRIERVTTPAAPLPTHPSDVALWLLGTAVALLAIRAVVRVRREGASLRVGAAFRAVPRELDLLLPAWPDERAAPQAWSGRRVVERVLLAVLVVAAGLGVALVLRPLVQGGVNLMVVDASAPAAFGLWASDIAWAISSGLASGGTLLLLAATNQSSPRHVPPVSRPAVPNAAPRAPGAGPHVTKLPHVPTDGRDRWTPADRSPGQGPGSPEQQHASEAAPFSVLRLLPTPATAAADRADDLRAPAPISVAVRTVGSEAEVADASAHNAGLRWPPPVDAMRPPSTSIEDALAAGPERSSWTPEAVNRSESIPPPDPPGGT